MNNIEFLSNLKVPHIDTDSMVISGDLTVKGDTIVEKTVDKVIEGAVSVINGTGETVKTAMLGQVILTGSVYLSGTCQFNDVLTGITSENAGQNIWDLELTGDMYVNSYQADILRWHDDNPSDPTARKTLEATSNTSGLSWKLYDSANGGWCEENKDLYFGSVSIPKYLNNWLIENIQNPDACLRISDYDAYAILYDPVTDAVRLGKGTYDLEAENPTFTFFEGEGAPVAVRVLTTKDDGSFVIWDADKYCLVKAPLRKGSGDDAIISGSEINRRVYGNTTKSSPEATGRAAFAGGHNIRVGETDEQPISDIMAVTTASGDASFAFGIGVTASGEASNATGIAGTKIAKVTAEDSDARIGYIEASIPVKGATASGKASTASGFGTVASGDFAHAEGLADNFTKTVFFDQDVISVEGSLNSASGYHTIVDSYAASGTASHVEGINTSALERAAHAEGHKTKAFSEASHAEGFGSLNWVATFELVESTDPTVVSGSQFKLINGAIPLGADHDNLLRITLVSQQTGTHYAGYTTTYGEQGDVYFPFSRYLVYRDSSASTSIESELELGKFDVFVETSNSAGLRGYYIWGIDAENKIITLAQTKEEAIDSSNEPTAFSIQYKVYDLISICGDYEYPNFTEILSIENNKIEVAELPIYYTNTDANGEYNYTHWSNEATTFVNNTVYCLQKPDIGNVDLGRGAHVEGVNNVAYGQGAHAEGYDNKALGSQAHVEGSRNTAGYCAHAEGKGNQAIGKYAHAEGRNVVAGTKVTDVAHAEGNNTKATGEATHAEGHSTTASGWYSHAEGHSSTSSGQKSHAEGAGTTASGVASHAEGSGTEAKGDLSHAEGSSTHATQTGTHAEGHGTTASGWYSHAEGQDTTASGNHSHSEGISTTASSEDAHAEGYHTTASGKYSHAQGQESTASGIGAHAEGWKTNSTNLASHAEGRDTRAYSNYAHTEGYNTETIDGADTAHAEGYSTKAHGHSSHAEGRGTEATGAQSHAGGNGAKAKASSAFAHGINVEAAGEAATAFGLSGTNYDDSQTVWTVEASGQGAFAAGMGAKAKGIASHAEGRFAQANANYAHAEGYFTSAGSTDTDSAAAHAEGYMTVASGHSSHAEGRNTKAIGNYSHAEGMATTASGIASHAGGDGSHAKGKNAFAHGQNVRAFADNQFAVGKWNAENDNALFIVGNGSSDTSRNNVFEVLKDGSAYIGKEKVATEAKLLEVIAQLQLQIDTLQTQLDEVKTSINGETLKLAVGSVSSESLLANSATVTDETIKF